jgi:hypothetical protein
VAFVAGLVAAEEADESLTKLGAVVWVGDEAMAPVPGDALEAADGLGRQPVRNRVPENTKIPLRPVKSRLTVERLPSNPTGEIEAAVTVCLPPANCCYHCNKP